MEIYRVIFDFLCGDNEGDDIFSNKEKAIDWAKEQYQREKNDEDLFGIFVYRETDELGDGYFRTKNCVWDSRRDEKKK